MPYEQPAEEIEEYDRLVRKDIEKKLGDIERVFNYYPEIGNDQEREKIIKSVANLKDKLEKAKPEQIKHNSHFCHILGQLDVELGYAPRLRKYKQINDLERIRSCKERLKETSESVKSYLDLNLNNQDYFYGEISSERGYFGDRKLEGSDKRIESLNADEFISISRDRLSSKAVPKND